MEFLLLYCVFTLPFSIFATKCLSSWVCSSLWYILGNLNHSQICSESWLKVRDLGLSVQSLFPGLLKKKYSWKRRKKGKTKASVVTKDENALL